MKIIVLLHKMVSSFSKLLNNEYNAAPSLQETSLDPPLQILCFVYKKEKKWAMNSLYIRNVNLRQHRPLLTITIAVLVIHHYCSSLLQ